MRTIWLIVKKEITQVLRDKIMRIQIIVPPVMQLIVLSHAMTFAVSDTSLALVDLDQTPAARRLTEAFVASGRFEVETATASGGQADEALLARDAKAVLRIPEGMERALRQNEAPQIQLILNAEDGAAAGVISSYAQQIIVDWQAAETARHPRAVLTSGAAPDVAGVTVQTRKLYNPEGEYLAFMSIGLLATLLTLVGILLTSQNIAREKEIGTLEQLNVTPISKGEFIIGKMLPFLLIGLFQLTLGLVIIRWAFGISFVGSVPLVYLGGACYLLAALGIGLLISTVVDTQQQAMFVTFFLLVTLFFLGGIYTPIQSMPSWAQDFAAVNPINHFVTVVRGVLMKGATLPDIAPHLYAMLGAAAVVIGISLLRYRKTAG